MVVKELFARLGLDVESSGFKEADSLFLSLDKAVLGLGVAAGAAAAALTVLVKQTADAGDNAKVAAARLGISTDAVQELGYAAAQSDTSIEALQQAFTFLAKKGVKDVDAAFAKIAEQFAALPNDGSRAKFAFDELGKAGKELAPLLAEGADGLAALRAEARDMGLVLGSDAVEAGDRFNDTLGRIGKRLDGLRNRVVGPWLAKFERGLVRLEKVVASLSDALAEAAHWLDLIAIVIGSTLAAALVVAIGGFEALAIEAFLAGMAGIEAAIGIASAWAAAAAPVVALAALFVVVALVLEDIYGLLTGADSLIGEIGQKWTDFLDRWKADPGSGWLGNALKAVVISLTDLGEAVPNAVRFWRDSLLGFFSWVADQFGVLAAKAMAALEAPLGALRRLFGNAPSPVSPEGDPTASAPSFGGGDSPTASASSSPASGPVLASNFNAAFNITTQPGQNPQEIAGVVRDSLEAWHNAKMRETIAAVGA